MKKYIPIVLLFSLAINLYSQSDKVPFEIKNMHKRIATFTKQLNEITTENKDKATINLHLKAFDKKLKTLNLLMENLKKRYQNKYDLSDLEGKHLKLINSYNQKLSNQGFSEEVPSDVSDFYKKMDKTKAEFGTLVSGKYEKHVVDRMLLSFKKSQLPKLKNELTTLQERYKGQKYETSLQASYDSMLNEFEIIKSGVATGEINITSKEAEIKRLRELKNQLMMFSVKWEYRAEQTQSGELASFVNRLIIPFNWKLMPDSLKLLSSSNLDAKNASKYLTNLIQRIKTEPHYTNAMLGFIANSNKIRNNNGYPNAEEKAKADNIVLGVEKSIEFAETICGPLEKFSKLKAEVKLYRNTTSKSIKTNTTLHALPASRMNNSNLEAELVKYFNALGWQENFYKSIITSNAWEYRKSTTGVIVSRTLQIAMVSKKKDGTCMYQNFTIIQQKIPSGYGKSKKLSVGGQKSTSCK